jgi:hypothetical protein
MRRFLWKRGHSAALAQHERGSDEDYHIDTPASQNPHGVPTYQTISAWLLLDSRVVDVPRLSNRIVVTLSSLKPLFFNGLKKALHFSDNVGA